MLFKCLHVCVDPSRSEQMSYWLDYSHPVFLGPSQENVFSLNSNWKGVLDWVCLLVNIPCWALMDAHSCSKSLQNSEDSRASRKEFRNYSKDSSSSGSLFKISQSYQECLTFSSYKPVVIQGPSILMMNRSAQIENLLCYVLRTVKDIYTYKFRYFRKHPF